MKSGAITVDDSYTSTLVRTTGDTWFYDATVTPGVRYYYWILGMNRYGYGTDSDSAWGFAGTPPAVVDLDAGKATYSDRIPISWGSMEGGAYEVWRGTTNDVGSAALVRLTGDTSCIDLSVASGERYYYWVRAMNRFGMGVYCDPEWGFAGTAPAVLGLDASDGTYTNRITVDWESLGGGTYQIWRNTSDYSGTAELRKTIGDCSWIDWDVIPGEVYYYWVNGVNRFGTGDIGDSDPGSANNE